MWKSGLKVWLMMEGWRDSSLDAEDYWSKAWRREKTQICFKTATHAHTEWIFPFFLLLDRTTDVWEYLMSNRVRPSLSLGGISHTTTLRVSTEAAFLSAAGGNLMSKLCKKRFQLRAITTAGWRSASNCVAVLKLSKKSCRAAQV